MAGKLCSTGWRNPSQGLPEIAGVVLVSFGNFAILKPSREPILDLFLHPPLTESMSDELAIHSTEISKRKSDARIQINNILSAVCLAVFVFFLTPSSKEGERTPEILLLQLVLTVPFLISSSLFCSKHAYSDGDAWRAWDFWGWFTHTVGYAFVLNSLALILWFRGFASIAAIFLAVVVALFLLHFFVSVIVSRRPMKRFFNLTLNLALLALGSVVPILSNLGFLKIPWLTFR